MPNVKKLAGVAACAATLLGAPALAHAGLIGLYQFNDATQLGLDTSGNGKNGTTAGNVSYSAGGYQGGAASFVNGSVSVPINVSTTALPQMTWGAWAKPTSGGAYQTVLSSDNGGYDREITIDPRGGSSVAWSAFTGGGVLNSGMAPSASAWTFLAASYNQATASMTFYVNGQSVGTASTNFGSSYNFFDIGYNPGHGEAFSGLIDNVFVYDQVLSSAQIAQIYANGFAVPEPGSLALAGLGGVLAAGFSARRRKALAQSA